MIELRDLAVGYGEKTVLEHLNMTFAPGQITVLLGPNGCGKSTLLKSLVGLSRVRHGQILLNGESLFARKPEEVARQVAYLPQGRRVPDTTVGRLVLHGRFPYLSYPRRYRPQDREAARWAMEQVGIEALAREPLARLSGGTRQKAYIAMALAQDTPAVLLDEPTTYLDIGHRLQLMELCRDLANRGKAVVAVLHDLPLALEYADRVAVLDGGTVTAWGTVAGVMESGALQRAFGVGIRSRELDGKQRYFVEKE